MTTWEIAIEQRLTESVHASLSLYRYDLKNLIDPVIDPADSLIYFYNKSKTTAQGIECEIRVAAAPIVGFILPLFVSKSRRSEHCRETFEFPIVAGTRRRFTFDLAMDFGVAGRKLR